MSANINPHQRRVFEEGTHLQMQIDTMTLTTSKTTTTINMSQCLMKMRDASLSTSIARRDCPSLCSNKKSNKKRARRPNTRI